MPAGQLIDGDDRHVRQFAVPYEGAYGGCRGGVGEQAGGFAVGEDSRQSSFVSRDPGAEEGYGDHAGVQAAEEGGRVVEPLGQDEGGAFAGRGDRGEVVGDGSGPGVEGAPAEGAVASRGSGVGEVDVAEGALLRPVPCPVPQMVRHEGGFGCFDSWLGGRHGDSNCEGDGAS